jgi:hypothetical protein
MGVLLLKMRVDTVENTTGFVLQWLIVNGRIAQGSQNPHSAGRLAGG